jgi:uncharacterized damage-inducible protein DinB
VHPFFQDYLERLQQLHEDIRAEIESLPQEALDWVPLDGATSLCAIVVHTAGAERYWIGDVAMEESSNRDREAEFRAKGISAPALVDKLAANLAYARNAVERLTLDSLPLKRVSPMAISSDPERTFSVGWALLHALEHTASHVGQIQIQRQLWEQRAKLDTT